jgi:hypothetical protein
MAAIIKMIATTINNSINENPFCFRIGSFPLLNIAGSSRPRAAYRGILDAVVSEAGPFRPGLLLSRTN